VVYGLDSFRRVLRRKIHFSGEVSMRIASDSTQILRSRIARVIALGAVVALAACEDVTAPQSPVAAAPELKLSQSGVDELGSLGSSLDDITGWSLAALPNGQGKANVVGILSGLKAHLNGRDVASCQQDVTDARAILASLSQQQQVEVGSVGVALDVIQSALDKASQ
jgi:hypothetical protein